MRGNIVGADVFAAHGVAHDNSSRKVKPEKVVHDIYQDVLHIPLSRVAHAHSLFSCFLI